MTPVHLSGEALSNAFPFHFALDRQLRFVAWGRSLPKIVPKLEGASLTDYFEVLHPPTPPSFDGLSAFGGLTRLVVKTTGLRLRGEFVFLADQGQVLFVGSPHLRDLSEVRGLGLTFDDFAVHDSVPDLLFLLQAAETARQESTALAARLDASERAAREATRLAEESSRAKGDFLAAFSHEIRTPLNAVVGLTQLALDGALDAETRAYLDRVHANATILLGLLNNVLDLSKIEARQMEVNDVSFDLSDAIESAVEAQGGRLSSEEVTLSLSIDPELPAFVRGDRVRLGQILTNLVGNALKFTSAGEVQVRARLKHRGEGRVVVTLLVSDTGIGIAPSDQARIFDRFFQVNEGQQVARGSGLGLNITASLVTLMGGSLKVDSALGRGSSFSVELPFTVDAFASRPVAGLQAPVTLVAPPGEVRDELVRCLRAEGLDVATAESLRAVSQRGPEQLTIIDGHVLRAHGDAPLPASLLPTRLLALLAPGQKLSPAFEGATPLLKPVGPRRLIGALQRLGTARGDERWRRSSIISLVPLRILFVDDNADNRFLGERLLRHTRCEVDFANDGAAALSLATTREYDLVLLDVEMPLMNGFEVAAAIRKYEGHGEKHVPIVAVTAHALEGFRQSCLDAGMDDYLTKPLSRDAFYAVLERYGALGAAPFTPLPQPAPGVAVQIDTSTVVVEADLAEIVPQFIANSRTHVAEAKKTAAAGDLTLAKRTGHNFKGIGVSYGFEPISALGAELERAARANDGPQVARYLDALERYLADVRWTVSPS